MPRNLRRLRRTESLRSLFRETQVDSGDLIYPIFVGEGLARPEPISSMPGISRLPVESLGEEAREVEGLGIGAVLLFGVPSTKDFQASSSSDPAGVVPRAIQKMKEAAPGLVVMTDVCVCAYMSHGHCGVLCEDRVDNEATLPLWRRWLRRTLMQERTWWRHRR